MAKTDLKRNNQSLPVSNKAGFYRSSVKHSVVFLGDNAQANYWKQIIIGRRKKGGGCAFPQKGGSLSPRKREGSGKSMWFPVIFQQTGNPRNKSADKNMRVREGPGYEALVCPAKALPLL